MSAEIPAEPDVEGVLDRLEESQTRLRESQIKFFALYVRVKKERDDLLSVVKKASAFLTDNAPMNIFQNGDLPEPTDAGYEALNIARALQSAIAKIEERAK
jgi:hypothetical protein